MPQIASYEPTIRICTPQADLYVALSFDDYLTTDELLQKLAEKYAATTGAELLANLLAAGHSFTTDCSAFCCSVPWHCLVAE